MTFRRSVLGANSAGAGSSSGAASAYPAARPVTSTKRYDPRTGLYNAHGGNMAKWRKALAKARAGVKSARLGVNGDSIVFGQYGTPAAFQAGWPARLRKMFDDRLGVRAGTGVHWCFQSYRSDDTRVVYTGATDVSGYGPFAKSCVSLQGANSITFGPVDCDSFTVYYLSQSGTGKTMGLSIDGGAVQNVNTGGGAGNAPATATITAASYGAHTLTITAVASIVYVVGFEGIVAGGKGVNVTGCGYPGLAAANFITSAGDATPTTHQFPLVHAAPDLTMIAFGANEWLGDQAVATFLANLQTAVGLVPVTSDVMLVTSVPNNKTTGPTGTQAAYDNQMWALADTLDIPVLDLSARWGTRAADPSIYFDNTHPNNVGYYDIAAMAFDALITGN